MDTSVSSRKVTVSESEEVPEDSLHFDDSSHVNQILTNLNKLRKNKQFCDVVLQVGSGQDLHEIHTHRAVVASVSPYLFDVFTQKTKGTVQNQCKLNGNFDIDVFERLVDYAYTSKLEVPRSKMKAMYIAATKLRMNPVAQFCGKYLVESLTPDNCTGVRSILSQSMDQELVFKVDCYIRQNIFAVLKTKELVSYPHIQVELIQHSNEEMDTTNEKHLYDMVLDWMKSYFDQGEVTMDLLTEKVHMLYLNLDRTLHDCNDIESGDIKDSEMIQDYKRLSRKLSQPGNSKSKNRNNSKMNPAKPRQFLYTRSDSSSSSSEEDDDKDWKVIATTSTGAHSTMGLAIVSGQMIVLSVVRRLNTSGVSIGNGKIIEKRETYTTVPPMRSSRCGLGTAEFQGKLLVCGGYDRGECLRTVESYDQSENKWISLSSMNVPRGRVDIAVIDGKVYVVGGSDGTKELNSGEVYDPSINAWKFLPPLSVARSNAGVCNLDGKLFVAGGWNGQRGLTCCDVYNPKDGTWTGVAQMLTGRYQAGVGSMNGEVYVVGGCESWNCINSVEKYNPMTNTWMMVSPLHNARRGCGLTEYNGKLYAVGGHDGVRSLCSVEIYDPQTNTWSPGPSLTSCRANVGVTVVGDRLYAVGGFNGKIFLNTVEFLDTQSNEWTTFIARESMPLSSPTINGRESSREGSAEECR